ncbi:hypothetical protein SEA_AMGINE_40 [Mycobacterium phage Amgine]|uniref:Uncharacterized protein n=1 Tax=Mycobacterium phage Amgine TaxID=2015817 RepID=A0A222ZNA5_9CAUD|nr:hypothetical protein I5G84_gp40 [Mycobacterium phage Amgine]ASR85641.1 hypothetical protein SEA_AMGINE_40 [Mycobacterium phage Amgine]
MHSRALTRCTHAGSYARSNRDQSARDSGHFARSRPPNLKTFNPQVLGSSPSGGTGQRGFSSRGALTGALTGRPDCRRPLSHAGPTLGL